MWGPNGIFTAPTQLELSLTTLSAIVIQPDTEQGTSPLLSLVPKEYSTPIAEAGWAKSIDEARKDRVTSTRKVFFIGEK